MKCRKDNMRSPKLTVAFCNAKQLEFCSHTLPSFQDKLKKMKYHFIWMIFAFNRLANFTVIFILKIFGVLYLS